MSETKFIKIVDIVTDAGTQVRAALDNNKKDEYAQLMRDGVEFSPVVIFHDGSRNILADGFHRVMAAIDAGLTDILAIIHTGSKSEALKFALSANARHGLPRTNADKRRSVELALAEWPNLSNREIEKICAVSDSLVADVRKQLPDSGSSGSGANTPRTGADGKTRKLPVKKEKKAEPEAGPESEATDSNPESAPEATDADEASASAVFARTERFIPAVGMEIAGGAIAQLRAITDDDSERVQAFQSVIEFCHKKLSNL